MANDRENMKGFGIAVRSVWLRTNIKSFTLFKSLPRRPPLPIRRKIPARGLKGSPYIFPQGLEKCKFFVPKSKFL